MNNTARRLLTPADIVITVLIIALSVILLLPERADKHVAVVTVNGDTVRQIPLTDNAEETITLDTDPQVTLRIADGKICFVEALCPDKTCQRRGELFKVGDTAACVPAGVVVTITGNSAEQEIDAVVG